MRCVPLVHLVGHAHIAGDIALIHDFPVKHLRHETVTEGQEKGHNAQADGYFLPNVFHRLFKSSANALVVARRV